MANNQQETPRRLMEPYLIDTDKRHYNSSLGCYCIVFVPDMGIDSASRNTDCMKDF